MGNFDFIEFDLEDLLNKKSILSDKHHIDRVMSQKDTAQGVLGQTAANFTVKGNKFEIKADEDDVRNIGSGTRCMKCGMLHFMWTPNCHSCGERMHFNMAHDGKPGRQIV